MVYATAVRKTLGYMAISLVLASAVMLFINGDTGVTGRATSAISSDTDVPIIVTLFAGIFVGAIVVGTYTYIAHVQKNE